MKKEKVSLILMGIVSILLVSSFIYANANEPAQQMQIKCVIKHMKASECRKAGGTPVESKEHGLKCEMIKNSIEECVKAGGNSMKDKKYTR